MEQRRFNFTVKKIEAIERAPLGERVEYFDEGKDGLGLRVTDKGVKTFFVRRRVDGRPVRTTLGQFPGLTLDDARKMAAETMGAIARGEDPNTARRAAREARTLEGLVKWYLDAPGKRKRKDSTREHYEWLLEKHLSSFAKRKATTITPSMVRDLHAKLTKDHGPYLANRAIALVSATYNKAIRLGEVKCANPAAGVERNEEEKREARLQPSQLADFLAALESHHNEDTRDLFSLCLLTGARKSNVMAMRWVDVNLADAIWRIPETKNGRPVSVPLLEREVAILTRRKESADGPWVFPGSGKTGHITEPKKAWRSILESAGITFGEIRIHDLRRTLGSLMADTGSSLPTIGKALGHQSPLTTAIYARLALDPLREAKAKAHAEIASARRLDKRNVIDLASKRNGTK